MQADPPGYALGHQRADTPAPDVEAVQRRGLVKLGARSAYQVEVQERPELTRRLQLVKAAILHEALGAHEVVLLNGHLFKPFGPVKQVAHLPPLTDQVVLQVLFHLSSFLLWYWPSGFCATFLSKTSRRPAPFSGGKPSPRPGERLWWCGCGWESPGPLQRPSGPRSPVPPPVDGGAAGPTGWKAVGRPRTGGETGAQCCSGLVPCLFLRLLPVPARRLPGRRRWLVPPPSVPRLLLLKRAALELAAQPSGSERPRHPVCGP